MAEPTLTPLKPHTETVAYRPISLLAVLGLVCAVIFVFIALLYASAGWLEGTPAFIPQAFLAIPAAGFVLCLLALRRIHLAEGTMTGDRLAKWGLWLSVVGGLGYGAYEFGNSMAIQQQANAFVTTIDQKAPNDSGLFEHIQNGDLNRAFLLTRTFTVRSGINPDDSLAMLRFDVSEGKEPQSPLDQFLGSDIVYQLQITEEKPTALGVRQWGFEEGSFVVERNYQVTTPEKNVEFRVRVQSTESREAGVGRKWQVVWPVEVVFTSPTKLGRNLENLREQSRGFFFEWLTHLSSGRKPSFPPTDETKWNEISVIDEQLRDPLQKQVAKFFNGQGAMRIQSTWGKMPWKHDNGHVQITHSFLLEAQFLSADARKMTPYYAHGKAVVQSTQPVDPHTEADSPGWEVVSYEITKLRPVPEVDEPR